MYSSLYSIRFNRIRGVDYVVLFPYRDNIQSWITSPVFSVSFRGCGYNLLPLLKDKEERC